MVAVSHMRRLRRLLGVLERRGDKSFAQSLKHVLDQVDDHFTVLPPPKNPNGMPAFTVRIQSNYNGNSRLLRWGDMGRVGELIGRPTGNYEGNEIDYGEFACYPIHTHGATIDAQARPAKRRLPPTRELIDVNPKALPAPTPQPWPFPTSAHGET